MKRTIIFLALYIAITVFQFCTSSRKAAKEADKITYVRNVQSLVQTNCAPCHFPPQGNKKPLNSYAALSQSIDEVIVRIQKNPGEKGFMPFKHPKLSDSSINVFVQWQKDGLLER
jgi:mono/diheme cytochrome c family protein